MGKLLVSDEVAAPIWVQHFYHPHSSKMNPTGRVPHESYHPISPIQFPGLSGSPRMFTGT